MFVMVTVRIYGGASNKILRVFHQLSVCHIYPSVLMHVSVLTDLSLSVVAVGS